MAQANDKCAELIKLYKAGTLERVPGCDLELSLEQMIGKELDGMLCVYMQYILYVCMQYSLYVYMQYSLEQMIGN
jgi:hypothetical protein